MKKAVLVALTLIISVAFTTGVFAQATSEPRKDTAPSTAPMVLCPARWLLSQRRWSTWAQSR